MYFYVYGFISLVNVWVWFSNQMQSPVRKKTYVVYRYYCIFFFFGNVK